MDILTKMAHLAVKLFLVYHLVIFQTFVIADEFEYKLVSDLLNEYNPLARPSLNHSEPTNVLFDFSLSQLIDVDEKNQMITTNAWITMEWVDYKLRWNETEYGGLKEIRLPFDKIWKPDIILYNNADALASLAQISTQMIIYSNGKVTWLSTSIYKSSCSIDVQYFPFDTQNCTLQFASWTYDGNSLNITKNPGDIGDTSNYLQNGEWNLNNLIVSRHVKKYSCCPNPYVNIEYHIVITRRPLFYIFNMIIPCFVITLVGFMGFLIPPASGEKTSLGVTTLLSMFVFLMAISDMMPPNSDSLPLISVYYFGSMLIISLATAGTVLTLNIHNRSTGNSPVPILMQRIFFGFIAKILCMNIELKPDLEATVSELYANLKAFYTDQTYDKMAQLKFLKHRRDSKSGINHKANVSYSVSNESLSCKKKRSSRQSQQRTPNHLLNSENEMLVINTETKSPKYLKEYQLGSVSFVQIPINKSPYKSPSRPVYPTGGFMSTSESPINNTYDTCCDISKEHKRISKILKTMSESSQKSNYDELIEFYKNKIKEQWIQLALIVDLLLMVLFIITLFVLIAYILGIIYFSRPNQLRLSSNK